jgi:acetolactate synthase-1/2/3 large subunit
MMGVDLHNPGFVSLANSFGTRGIKAEIPDQLRSALKTAFASPGPALIEIPVGELPSIWGLIKRRPSGSQPTRTTSLPLFSPRNSIPDPSDA